MSPRSLTAASLEVLASAEPKHCRCGWLRPTTWDFSEDEQGQRPIQIAAQEFFVVYVYDCPQCSARWFAKMARVS